MQKIFKHITPFTKALLNSYAVLFFSNNRVFALLLLAVSFFNPYAGFAGIAAAMTAISLAYFTGLNQQNIQKGMYSYNALIIGIGMGTLFQFGAAFWLLLLSLVVFSVILSAVLQSVLGKHGLPFLTIPFVLCFWLLLLVSDTFKAIDFSYRNIYWMNDAYAIGKNNLVNFILFFDNLALPQLVVTFFKALSSLYFQNNVLTGIIIAIGLLIHSRIIFSLIIIGFLSAYCFNAIVMAHPEGMNYYLMGGNFLLVSVAIGGYFIIPSLHSYLWSVIAVPITFIIVMGLGKITGQWSLPVFSLPFSITVLSMLYFFSVKYQAGRIVLTPLQFQSPEKNLYNYLNNKERLQHSQHIRLQLPFIGQWMVSQGHNGNITHKGDWSKALDFIIVDHQLKTYTNYATKTEDFYCYNKPVLAPADGIIHQIEDGIDDNEIGKINQTKNWGNTLIIKHAEGLYTKLSHLKKHSIKFPVGAFVKKGDIVASCGNSGRSPEPHLHFQIQTTPYIGSKTFAYPISYYVATTNGKSIIKEFSIPLETELVNNVNLNAFLQQAFDFLPGYNMVVQEQGGDEQRWEVFTDAYNQNYLYCHTTKSVAYFTKTTVAFYFASFEGDKKSLLYRFYTACYKVYCTTDLDGSLSDKFPLQLNRHFVLQWLQDIIAPFYIFSRLHFESYNTVSSKDFLQPEFEIHSQQTQYFLSYAREINQSTVQVKNNSIVGFTYTKSNKQIQVICKSKDY